MTFAITGSLLGSQCIKPKNYREHIVISSVIADFLLIITSLVTGILGATHVLNFPAAASYSLIGIAPLIVLMDTLLICHAITNPPESRLSKQKSQTIIQQPPN